MALTISNHAVERMAQRRISIAELHEALRSSTRTPDAAPAGRAPRWRCVGRTTAGRKLVVVVAGTPSSGTVVTVFET